MKQRKMRGKKNKTKYIEKELYILFDQCVNIRSCNINTNHAIFRLSVQFKEDATLSACNRGQLQISIMDHDQAS